MFQSPLTRWWLKGYRGHIPTNVSSYSSYSEDTEKLRRAAWNPWQKAVGLSVAIIKQTKSWLWVLAILWIWCRNNICICIYEQIDASNTASDSGATNQLGSVQPGCVKTSSNYNWLDIKRIEMLHYRQQVRAWNENCTQAYKWIVSKLIQAKTNFNTVPKTRCSLPRIRSFR